jgi:hypothetical protein
MENYNKKGFAQHLKEYIDLHIDSGAILVTSESGHKEVYQNIGTFLDDIRFEKEELLKDKIKLKSVTSKLNEDEGFQIYNIEVEIEGKVKRVSLQSRIFTDSQVGILCEKLEYILNHAA